MFFSATASPSFSGRIPARKAKQERLSSARLSRVERTETWRLRKKAGKFTLIYEERSRRKERAMRNAYAAEEKVMRRVAAGGGGKYYIGTTLHAGERHHRGRRDLATAPAPSSRRRREWARFIESGNFGRHFHPLRGDFSCCPPHHLCFPLLLLACVARSLERQ